MDFDAVVLGGGPCGLAAATALAIRGRRVGVFERNRFGGPRVGETLGPEIVTSLRQLGVFEDFTNLEKIPFRGVQSAWGASTLVDRPSIMHPLGEGFHVDRALFDELLARHAVNAGAELHEHMGVATMASIDAGWRLSWPNGREATTHFILDASGRGAPAGARGFPERHWVACDRTVGIVTRLKPPKHREFTPELLIETAELGWWYVALQPGPNLLCVWLTDADLVAAGRRDELSSRWQAAFNATEHVRALCAEAIPIDGPRVVRADTGFLLPNHGRAWRAIGDAAFASDPLSGDGLTRGLSDALIAARDVDEMLAENKTLRPDASMEVDKRIPTYLDQRRQYYRIERRWPEALFWKRRHAIDWSTAPIVLDPRANLCAAGQDPDSHTIAAIEGLIPPRVIRSLLQKFRTPHPAHVMLQYLRTVAPLGDRRLLVALQELIACDVLRIDTEDPVSAT